MVNVLGCKKYPRFRRVIKSLPELIFRNFIRYDKLLSNIMLTRSWLSYSSETRLIESRKYRRNLLLGTLYKRICLSLWEIVVKRNQNICRPPSLIELTPIIFYMELTHLGSEASLFDMFKLIHCNKLEDKPVIRTVHWT